MTKKNIVLSVQKYFGETDGMLTAGNAGSAQPVGIPTVGVTLPPRISGSRNGLGAGWSKVIRYDNWQAKADTVQGSFIR